jgi:tripartite-type tricarboxylate transporter receptor subunit TctC
MRHQATRRALGLGALGATALRPARAETWPSRPISLVVPWPPGGITDITARIFAEDAAGKLGQRLVVDNRSGAASRIGALAVARAQPDGHVLMVQNATHPLLRVLDPRTEFDPVADFTPIARMSNTCVVLAVNPQLPVRDIAGLVAHAGAQAVPLNYGSIGIGSAHHLLMERFQRLAGIALNHIPYRGEAPAVADLIAGRIAVMFVAGAKPYLDSGQIRGLAVSARGAWPNLPGLPPLRDSFASFEFEGWNGLFGPAGLPQAVVERLNGIANEGFATPRVRALMAAQGYDVLTGSAADFAARVAADVEFWRSIVAEARISLE